MEDDKRVYVRTLKDSLNLVQLSGNDDSLNRWIIVPDVNRPGLELSGFFKQNDLKRVVIIGNKETDYLETIDDATKYDRFQALTDAYTPCIVVSSNEGCPRLLLEVAQSKNFPIFQYQGQTSQLIVDIISLLSEHMAPSDSFHGVMMNIYGKGVMIIGDSGIGKSELALDLIKRGHMIVADDRVDLIRVHNDIVASAPEVLKGMLEVRGLGIVDVGLLFGGNCVLEKSELDLVIKLVKFDENEFDRANPEDETISILGTEKTMVKIPVSAGRPITSIVEAAVTNFILKQQGINTTEMFNERVIKAIERNRE